MLRYAVVLARYLFPAQNPAQLLAIRTTWERIAIEFHFGRDPTNFLELYFCFRPQFVLYASGGKFPAASPSSLCLSGIPRVRAERRRGVRFRGTPHSGGSGPRHWWGRAGGRVREAAGPFGAGPSTLEPLRGRCWHRDRRAVIARLSHSGHRLLVCRCDEARYRRVCIRTVRQTDWLAGPLCIRFQLRRDCPASTRC